MDSIYQANLGLPEIPDRWCASLLLDDPDYSNEVETWSGPFRDYDAQLEAVGLILSKHTEVSKEIDDQIQNADHVARRTSGMQNERAVDEYIYHAHRSVYSEAAISVSAAALIAPLLESMFRNAFLGIGKRMRIDGATRRDVEGISPMANGSWSIDAVSGGGPNSVSKAVRGIKSLAISTGLVGDLEPDFALRLDALFTYRNKALHKGFEWSSEDHVQFQSSMQARQWQSDWFSKSQHGSDPWIHYLKKAFVASCIDLADSSIEAIGRFSRRHFFPAR